MTAQVLTDTPTRRSAAPPAPASRNRLHSLTGLRAVAAGMVFVFHITSAQLTPFVGRAAANAGSWFADFGAIGVSFFFLLSGYVLTWSMRENERPGRFLRRRLVRVYPNHLVTFVLALLLFAGAGATTRIWLPNLLLVHAWTPSLDVLWGVNPLSWSLSCEAFFYLCFPLLFAAVRRIRPGALWACAGVTAALVLAAPAVAYATLPGATGINAYGMPVSTQQFWFVYALPPVRMLEFVLGMLMARIVLSGRWVRISAVASTVLLVAAFALTFHLPYLYRFNAATVIPLALLIPACAVHEGRGGWSFLRSRGMVRAGEISFAFYMIQGVVLITLTRLFFGHQPFGTGSALGVIAAFFVLCVAAAWALHALVERPLVRYLSVPRAERARSRD